MNALLSSKPEPETETGTKRGAETGTETESAVRGAEPAGTGAHDARRIPATPAAPGPLASFARFVLCGGGIGVLSSFAVPLVAGLMPWAVANAVITVASTILCTELHARFTFGSGKHA